MDRWEVLIPMFILAVFCLIMFFELVVREFKEVKKKKSTTTSLDSVEQAKKPKKPKRCYLISGELASFEGKTIRKVNIINEESFAIVFDDISELTIELDQEYEGMERIPRYGLLYGILDRLNGKKVITTEILTKNSFEVIFDDEDKLTIDTPNVEKEGKEKYRTLRVVLKNKNGKEKVLF